MFLIQTCIETALVMMAVFIIFIRPHIFSYWFGPVERGLAQLARKRLLAVAVVGVSALVARAALLPVLPIPQPAIHDEFGYLLIGDTFAHGRVANPTHPMWPHFETFHVNHRPAYTAMFYPAQGVFLAVGQAVLGHPFWGVWLSVGLMCAAICWMLQGWLPPLWALIGGLIAVMRLGVFSYWANRYWGGAVAALGGALVIGALPRIKHRRKVRDALLMGLGLAILANSRPYESVFFCLPVGLLMLTWMFGKSRPGLSRARTLLPLGLVLCITIGAMGYYFWRTTGSPFRTPYLVNKQTYYLVYFPWEKLNPAATFRYPEMREYYLRLVVKTYNDSHSLTGFAANGLATLLRLWLFFMGPILSIPIVTLIFILPSDLHFKDLGRRTKFLLCVLFITLLGLFLPIFFFEHYSAPLTCVIYALLLIAMQRVRRWRRGSARTGVALVRAVPVLCLVFFLLSLVQLTRPAPGTLFFGEERAKIESQLVASRGNHLVIVHYKPQHDPFLEWVFNHADIDRQRVVWARDMGPRNEELINYYKDRHVWLLEADDMPPKISPYFSGASAVLSAPDRETQ